MDLVKQTEAICKEVSNYFLYEDVDFYNNIFDIITLQDQQSSREILAKVYYIVFKSNSSFQKYFHVVMQTFVCNIFFSTNKDMYKLETSYNYRLIWPIIDGFANLSADMHFQPGEIRLLAVSEELKECGKDKTSFYNADGILFYEKHEIEILMMETTGPFQLSNSSKETRDYIKTGYELVSMIYSVGRKVGRTSMSGGIQKNRLI